MNKKVQIVHPRSGRATLHYLPSDALLAEAVRAMNRNIAMNRGTAEGEANEARLETIERLRD